MKWAAFLCFFPLGILAADGLESWSLLNPKDVPTWESNPWYRTVEGLDQFDRENFEHYRGNVETLLQSMDYGAEKQARGLTEFSPLDHPTPELDAAALLLENEGRVCVMKGDFVTAKPILENVWRKYPFVRLRYEKSVVWMPAKDAYSDWQMIVWMEAIRGKKMDKYPFDPDASIYHDSNGAQGTLKGEPLEHAARHIFKTDGPQLLESAMEQMLASKEYTNPDHARFLEVLIQGLCTPEDQTKEQEWEDLRAKLEKWVRDSPQSSLAKLALVEFWTGYAWNARGDGWASSVTADGWKLFDERLHKALRVQCQAVIKNPVWYASGLLLGTALGADMDKEAAMCDEGLEKFPWALHIHNSMIMYLLPRWHGQPGDWQRFARAVGKKQGPETYLALVRCARNIWQEGDVTTDPLVDWKMVWKGYEARLKNVCSPWAEANEYAQQACQRGDKEAARAAFAHPESRFHPLYWKNRADYEWWKQWATQP